MSDATPDDWDGLVETVRREFHVGNDDGDDEGSISIEAVWQLVDAAEERLDEIDPAQISRALGVDPDGADVPIPLESIPDEFAADDPERAARLSKLITLVNLDETTDYDIERLWSDGQPEDGASTTPEDEPPTAADAATEPDAGSTSDEGETDRTDSDATAEEFSSTLGEALSALRGQIQDARARIGEDDGSDATDPDEAGSDDDGADERSIASPDRGGGPSASRPSTAFSTMPSRRVGRRGVGHVSTVPGRGSRSRDADRSSE